MIVAVTVKTGSKKGPLVEAKQNGELTVYLRARPHDGEANAELTKLLARHFRVAKTRINIKSGTRSHHKKIEII